MCELTQTWKRLSSETLEVSKYFELCKKVLFCLAVGGGGGAQRSHHALANVVTSVSQMWATPEPCLLFSVVLVVKLAGLYLIVKITHKTW